MKLIAEAYGMKVRMSLTVSYYVSDYKKKKFLYIVLL